MIRFLLKGLLRDRTRSLFPVLMICAGTFLTVALYSFMKGAISDFLDSGARFGSGHVKIMTRAYNELSDQLPNDLALLNVGELLAGLKKEHPDLDWTPRIRFGGLLDVPDEQGETKTQGPAMGLGVDLMGPGSPEPELLNLKKSLVRGRLPQNPGEALISDSFARKLGLEMGQTATLLGSTMHGAMTSHNFKIVGAVVFGLVALDRSVVIVDLEDARAALDMADGAGEILGFAKNMVYDDKAMKGLAGAFNQARSDPADEFSPVMLTLGQQGGMGDYLELVDAAAFVIVGVFVFAMSIVLWNAGLMNGLRRYGEIGVRLAVGESKGALYRAMIFESIMIGLAGSALGTGLGLALSYYFQYVGWDMSAVLQKSTVMISNVIRSRVTPTSYYIGFIPGLFASVLGTLFAGIGIYKRQTSRLFKELET